MHPSPNRRRRSLLVVSLFLLLSGHIAAPDAAKAQCTVSTVVTSESANPIVFKVLTGLSPANNATAACTLESSMGPLVQCFERVTASSVQATAYGSQLPASVSCRWTCNTVGGTCSVTIDNSSGLPVELMGFSIESDDPAGDEDGNEDGEDLDRDPGQE